MISHRVCKADIGYISKKDIWKRNRDKAEFEITHNILGEYGYNFKKKLASTKEEQTTLFKTKETKLLASMYDSFKFVKYWISKKYNIRPITNAWMKCYELLHYYNLLESCLSSKCAIFDNASLPGAFLMLLTTISKQILPIILLRT